MKILLDYRHGVTKCKIAQEHGWLLALTCCCVARFELSSMLDKEYICTECRGSGTLHHWDSTGTILPTRYLLGVDDTHVVEWISKWTGIASKDLGVQVDW